VRKTASGQPRVGMFSETLRQENIGAQMHRTSSELAEQFALDPDVAAAQSARSADRVRFAAALRRPP